MSNLTSITRRNVRTHQPPRAVIERFDPPYPQYKLQIASRYKRADRKFEKGSDLFQLGEKEGGIYNVVEGWVALYKLFEDGRRQILQFSLPGTILAFVPTPRTVINYSGQALTDVVVCIVPQTKLNRLVKECPEVGIQVAGLISQDLALAYDQLSSLGGRSARERVAHLLLELYVRSRMCLPSRHNEEIHFPLTQEHIGDATGLIGIHVNRVLRNLSKEGVLKFQYRRLCILNPDKLIDVAAIDLSRLAYIPRSDSSP